MVAPSAAGQPAVAQPPQAEAGKFRVAGTAVNSITGHALARVQVSLADTKSSQKAVTSITSDEGRFEFDQVPSGKYSLQGAKRGFINAAYDQHGQFSTAIVTGAGPDTEHLTLRLPPVAVLSGRILDESGDPVRHAGIFVYRENNFSGVSRIQIIRGAMTDDRGAFEVTPLVAGTYFVSVKAAPWYAVHRASTPPESTEAQPSFVDRSLDVAYPITYYSDATDSESATPIPMRGGDHVEVDIHLNPVPSVHVVFRMPEDAQNRGAVPTLQQSAFDGVTRVQDTTVQMISPGVYEISGVAAGRYTIRAPGAETGSEWTEIDLTGEGQELDTSSSQATSSIKAAVQVQGETKFPQGLGIALRNRGKRVVAWSEVNEKGEVEFNNLSAGQYEVLAGAQEKEYSVVRIASSAGEIPGHPLSVASGASLSLSFTLVTGSVAVEGVVKRAGKPVAGAMIVLVPKNPEANRDRFRRDQSDLDGTFNLRGVIPGTYTAVAIDNGWDLDWGQPGVIATYARHGQTVTVASGSTGVVRLNSSLEAQSR